MTAPADAPEPCRFRGGTDGAAAEDHRRGGGQALPGGGEAIVPGRAGFELPEGFGAIEWPANEPLNTAARRVNEKTGRVEPHRPDPPDGGDELRRWHWDEAAERWLAKVDSPQRALEVQARRAVAVLDAEARAVQRQADAAPGAVQAVVDLECRPGRAAQRACPRLRRRRLSR